MARFFLNENSEHPHLVVCSIENEQKLIQLIEKLKFKNIPFKSFYEPDIDSITSICTSPLSGNDRKVFSNFKLVKSPTKGD